MDAKVILRAQLEMAQGFVVDLVGSMTRDEWLARAYPSSPMLGFTAWHMPATVDWAVQAWLLDAPELRTRAPFSALPGINPPCTPFGMPGKQADEIARAVSRDDVVAYARATFGAAIAWLDAASDGELTAPTDAVERLTSQAYQRAPGYIEEAEWMRGFPAWRMLVSPCYGHIRGHLGEMDAALTALRSRA